MAKVRVTWERHFQYQSFNGEKITLSLEEEIKTTPLAAKDGAKGATKRAEQLAEIEAAMFKVMSSVGDEITKARIGAAEATMQGDAKPKQEKNPGPPKQEEKQETAEDLPW